MISCLHLANEGWRASQAIRLRAVQLTSSFLSKRTRAICLTWGKKQTDKRKEANREVARCSATSRYTDNAACRFCPAARVAVITEQFASFLQLLGRSYAYALIGARCAIMLAESLLSGVLSGLGIFYASNTSVFSFFIQTRIVLHKESRFSKGNGEH